MAKTKELLIEGRSVNAQEFVDWMLEHDPEGLSDYEEHPLVSPILFDLDEKTRKAYLLS